MGSGKTTIGPALAERLGYGFTDLDDLIEQRAGKPIPVLFAEEGEPAFRKLEAELLREATGWERVVVALGGGALTVEENLQRAREAGTVVYLRVPLDQLTKRLLAIGTGRPLLMGSEGRPLDASGLRRRVAFLIGAREPFYSRAQVTVDVGEMGPEETVEAVVRAVGSLQ